MDKAYLINRTYFINGIHIPQLDYPAVGNVVDLNIQQLEPQFMGKLMGYGLYEIFMGGLAAGEQRWIDLKNGKTYVDGRGETIHYTGLANNTNRLSPIAHYVYYWWMRDRFTITTASGELANKVENGTRYSPAQKMVTAWNEMVKLNLDFLYFMQNNRATYPEWQPVETHQYRRHFAHTHCCTMGVDRRRAYKGDLFTTINLNNI